MWKNHFNESLKPKKQKIIFVLGLLVIFVIGSGFFLGRVIFVSENRFPDVRMLEISSGSGVKEIANQLKRAGIIKYPRIFEYYARLTRKADRLQAGLYALDSNMSLREVVTALTSRAMSADEVRLTIIEGWTSTEIAQYLKKSNLHSEGFLEIVKKGEFNIDDDLLFKSKPKNSSLEGYLFPDTYFVYKKSSGEEIVEKMIKNFQKKIDDDLRAQIKKSPLSFYEILTLASIVEKEVANFNDRQLVAGIFLKRLSDGYPLESDATINFITGKNITRPTTSDLEQVSAYNTYNNLGLTPGPIGNPGLDAIKAVLSPQESEYYFFLTTPEPQEQVIYSRSFEEHLQNKRKFYP